MREKKVRILGCSLTKKKKKIDFRKLCTVNQSLDLMKSAKKHRGELVGS